MYSAGGRMCGQLMNPDRKKFASESNPTAPEALQALNGV
jgi:hypothetical protein